MNEFDLVVLVILGAVLAMLVELKFAIERLSAEQRVTWALQAGSYSEDSSDDSSGYDPWSTDSQE